ncbi:hypothetical protein EGR_10880 [Echinococcus granulosus]|uniref:Uncharacterized protein n=1 Tax=Echinococcus granulosus TaxID=6210 RepID=W6U194_ECHGR|nr:hypothetical protein EGR_10880 [Echinococcus granulosus]EUB54261.1 hypothetical protein EGR_10880 [Echinococcus granulosus]
MNAAPRGHMETGEEVEERRVEVTSAEVSGGGIDKWAKW